MLNISNEERQFIPLWRDNQKQTDPISIGLKAIKYADFWKLSSAISKFSQAAIDERGGLLVKFKPLVQPYITGIDNLCVDNSPANIDTLFAEPVLLPLLMEVIGELLKCAQVSEVEKKD